MDGIKEYVFNQLSQLDGWTAYGAIVGVLLACGLGVPIPEDITLIAAGVLASLGSISLSGAIVAGFFGVLAGDTILFNLGRFYGRRAFQLPIIRRWMTPRRIALAERRVIRNSHVICFTARFLPGLRAPIYLTAGILGVRPLVFYSLDGFAALISVPLWVLLGHWLGQNLDQAFQVAERMQLSLIGLVILLIGGYLGWRRVSKLRRARRIRGS
jgi:membrane protein DedA with SNARE-associated domain